MFRNFSNFAKRIPLVVANEKGGSLNLPLLRNGWGCKLDMSQSNLDRASQNCDLIRRTTLEREAKDGNSPVVENHHML